MKLEELILKDFRNIELLHFVPGETVNIFYGDNAQGKTNILEAIYLLTGQRSFRQSRESDYMRFGTAQAELTAAFFQGGRSQKAKLIFSKGTKTAYINSVPSQPSELTGLFCAVVFSPTELALVKEGPALRRSFLDSAISQVMPRYLAMSAAFSRILTQRNSLLFDMARNPGMQDLLAVWDRSFAKAAYSLIHARSRYVSRIAAKAKEIYAGISGGREELGVSYFCTVSCGERDWGEIQPGEGEKIILSALNQMYADDIKNGFTTIGPHRDDLSIWIDNVPARNFGSQGQQRSCALALKLAECSVLEEITGEKPLLLLDDVFSELDRKRRDFLLSGIVGGQIFITCCDRTGFRSIKNGVAARVKAGTISGYRELGKPEQ